VRAVESVLGDGAGGAGELGRHAEARPGEPGRRRCAGATLAGKHTKRYLRSLIEFYFGNRPGGCLR
jgi:hypothetical protein